MRAAATGSAAAGERTSSGELPVSVTPPAWDSGQRRVSVRDLPPDVRLRLWRFRAIVVIVVGVVFTIVARLAGRALARHPGRHHRHRVPVADRRGLRGRRQRGRRARGAPGGSSPGCAATGTSRSTRGPSPTAGKSSTTWSIGPTGVYAIDSEKWDKRVPIRTCNGKRLYLGPEITEGAARARHLGGAAGQRDPVRRRSAIDVPVRAALAIYGPKIPWDIATIRDVDVFTGTALAQVPEAPRPDATALPRLTREQVRHDLRHGEQRCCLTSRRRGPSHR